MYALIYRNTDISETRILGIWTNAKNAVKYGIYFYFENSLLDISKCNRHNIDMCFFEVGHYERTSASIKQIFVDNVEQLAMNYEMFINVCNCFGKNVVDWDTGVSLWSLSIEKISLDENSLLVE